jgi:hypothetical protein
VSVEQLEEPSQWQRAKWLFGGLWLTLTVLPLFNALLVPPPAPDVWILVLNSVLALSLGAFLARDMWRLKVRRSPLIVDVLLYAVVLGGVVLLIVVKETKLFVWNSLHLDLPVFLLLGTCAVAAWVTEATKGVRIYVGARHLIFVGQKDGL